MAKNWTREQLLVALRLYCRTPFGKLHHRNPDIIRIAEMIGRTPSAVSMKACNLASLDPAQAARGISGLKGAASADKELWREFEENPEAIANEAEAVWESLSGTSTESETRLFENSGSLPIPPTGPTDVERLVRARRVQGFFRDAVLVSYNGRCALTGIAVPELLNASHIIPWSVDEARRADPSNGICLNALYDRAFDRGLLTFDEDLRAVLSERLQIGDPPPLLLNIAGKPLQLPDRFRPDLAALEYHREHVFQLI
jgi:predicted restriction endonuclease